MQIPGMGKDSVDMLNSMLAGEISAAESYNAALKKMDGSPLRETLEKIHVNHARRAQMIRDRVEQLGGKPVETSGPWGAFVKLLESSATAFGDKAAISVLEEGEDKGLKDYEGHIEKTEGMLRSFVEQELLPLQRMTHHTMSELKHSLQQ